MAFRLPLRFEPGTALWVDAAGTLLHPARPIADVYAEHARALGHAIEPDVVAARLGSAMRRHRDRRRGDPSWRGYWRAVVFEALGTDDERCLETLYDHYAAADAWTIAPQARACIDAVRARGARVALISNWDVRLRSTLEELGLVAAFDALVISAEVGVEKPQPEIFRLAAERLGVEPHRSVMLGDQAENDARGARSVGAFVIQFGSEIRDFGEIVGALD